MNILFPLQVAEAVRMSSKLGHNVSHIVNDAEYPIIFYEWKSCKNSLSH